MSQEKNYRNSLQDERLSEIEKSVKTINSEMGDVKTEMGKIKVLFSDIRNEFAEIKTAIKEIEEKINKRPTWFITSTISILLSTLIGLAVYIITH